MPTCARDPEFQSSKRQKFCLEMNTDLLESSFVNNLKDKWKQGISLANKGLELIVDPFKVCVIQDFLQNKELTNDIRQEFYEQDYNQRHMDLYEFFQSKDLKYLNSEHLKNMYEFLQKDVMKWVCII